MTSEVIWRLPWPRRPSWPRRPLEAICTWISGLLISNLRSNDLRGRLEAATVLEAVMALETVGGNMHMDTRVIRVADFKSEVK